MKTPTDHIFQLINSMTASEKRYFKRHYSSEKSLITTLFDYINSQSEYNEDDVKAYFADSKLSKNLKVYKVQLTDVLLKSLISYHNKKNIRSKIRMGLEEIDILVDKKLFDIAQSKIKRIKDICIKGEAFEHIFPILQIEQYLTNFYSANQQGDKNDIFDELSSYVGSIENVLKLQNISHQLSDIKNHILTTPISEDDKNNYRQLLKTELKNIDEGKGSIREQYYRYHVIAMIYRLVEEDLHQEHFYKNEQINLLRRNPNFIEAYPKLFFASLYNLLSSFWKRREYEQLENGIKEINAFVSKNPLLEPNLLFVHYLELFLIYAKQLNGFNDIFESKVMKHIRNFKKVSDYLSSLIYIHFALLHLVSDNHRKVQFFLRRLDENLNLLDPAYGPLLYTIELISHYQSGDYDIMQNTITSHLRKLKRSSTETDKTFKTVILFFQSLIKASSKDEESQMALEFKKEQHDNSSRSVTNLLEEYGFSIWLNSVINQLDLKEAIISQYHLPTAN